MAKFISYCVFQYRQLLENIISYCNKLQEEFEWFP